MNKRDLNLMVGAGLLMQKQDSDERYLVELLGYMVGKGVIISAPQESNERLAVKPGDEVTIRYMGGVSRYAFRSQVTYIANEPYAHIHLAYPRGVEAAMMRRAVRVPVKKQGIRLVINDQGKKLSVAMEDISHGGARLVAAQLLGHQGECFNIDIPTQVPDRETVMSLACVVRHVREEQQGGQSVFHHGIEFQYLDAASRSFIRRFITQELEATAAPV